MSFILDALKKAEAERQRQTGPTLLEVRVSAPRRRFPLWTVMIGALLGVNILLLLVFVLRRPIASAVTPEPAPAPAASAPSAMVPAAVAPAPAAMLPPTPTPAPAPVLAPAPMLTEVSPRGAAITDPTAEGPAENPADYESAVPATNTAHREPPSLQEIGGDLPDLRLDLHVYAARAADRYALINMHRVHEGDVLPEGPRVLEIDRDGVELSYRGTDFMLRPQ